MHNIEEYLHNQEIEADLIQEVTAFRNQYSVPPEVRERIAAPSLPFYGKDTLEMALAAILQGENLLLSGGKATGKMCCVKPYPGCSAGHPTIFRSTSTQIVHP